MAGFPDGGRGGGRPRVWPSPSHADFNMTLVGIRAPGRLQRLRRRREDLRGGGGRRESSGRDPGRRREPPLRFAEDAGPACTERRCGRWRRGGWGRCATTWSRSSTIPASRVRRGGWRRFPDPPASHGAAGGDRRGPGPRAARRTRGGAGARRGHAVGGDGGRCGVLADVWRERGEGRARRRWSSRGDSIRSAGCTRCAPWRRSPRRSAGGGWRRGRSPSSLDPLVVDTGLPRRLAAEREPPRGPASPGGLRHREQEVRQDHPGREADHGAARRGGVASCRSSTATTSASTRGHRLLAAQARGPRRTGSSRRPGRVRAHGRMGPVR